MDDKQHIEKLKKQGWEDMSALLDEHMPEETDKGIVWWYWLAGAAAVILAVMMQWFFLQDSGSTGIEHLPNTDKVVTVEKPVEPDILDRDDIDSGSEASAVINSKSMIKDQKILYAPFKGNGKMVGLVDEQKKEPISASSVKQGLEARTSGATKKEDQWNYTSSDSERLISSVVTHQDQLVHPVGLPSMSVSPGIRNIMSPRKWLSPEKVITPVHKRQLIAMVFTEGMGSLSDAFGFISAGPGLQYQMGKWSVSLSAGVSVPMPERKIFSSSNLDFSNQYNFNDSRDSKVETSSPGFSNSSSVYYERYTMKPGWIANISFKYRLTRRWAVSANVGHVGFHYDYVRKAEPNPHLAANTDLSDVQNSLWNGGLSLSYQIGHQWQLFGGVRMVNLWDADAEGILPVLRMEYVFK